MHKYSSKDEVDLDFPDYYCSPELEKVLRRTAQGLPDFETMMKLDSDRDDKIINTHHPNRDQRLKALVPSLLCTDEFRNQLSLHTLYTTLSNLLQEVDTLMTPTEENQVLI